MSIAEYRLKKEKLRILILGPYRPEAALSRLENLKSSLIANGFKLAKLAKDFEDEPLYSQDFDEHYTLKSRKNHL
jgi:hypothetical protein